MNPTWWILEATGDTRFPFRLTIQKDDQILLRLRVQEKWPGTNGQVFCLREELREWPPPLEEVERVPVVSLKRYGKRLVVVLDRGRNKRCDLLFLKRPYKTREGEYEQIFWRTQQALRGRRPRVKLTTYGSPDLHVIIDSREKYAWKFGGSVVERGKLPVGDYALRSDTGLLAVVERKTFDNLVAEFGRMSVLHQQLAELEGYQHSALVIEADYSDFLNPTRLKFYAPTFAAKAIGEVFAFHPKLSIVFAGNRKLAYQWTLRFFTAIHTHTGDVPHPTVSEAITAYGEPPPSARLPAGSEVRKQVATMPEEFAFRILEAACPNISAQTIRNVLAQLTQKGELRREGKGRGSTWRKVGSPSP